MHERARVAEFVNAWPEEKLDLRRFRCGRSMGHPRL